MSERLKVVFDTQIFLRALINQKSASAKIRPKNWRGHYLLLFSDAIEAEVKDVLTRQAIRARFAEITDEMVEETLNTLQQEAQRVKVESVEPISRDPKDDIFLACAKTAKADYLVSEDKDLLVLKRHHDTQIVDVITFLSVLEARKSADGSQEDS